MLRYFEAFFALQPRTDWIDRREDRLLDAVSASSTKNRTGFLVGVGQGRGRTRLGKGFYGEPLLPFAAGFTGNFCFVRQQHCSASLMIMLKYLSFILIKSANDGQIDVSFAEHIQSNLINYYSATSLCMECIEWRI